nr:MAG TPA: hypothetical protein [Caudoviricetes sp.]DAV28314.1 MAG TPA: hypothetical protein [Caudoviricetes sp.]
MNGILLPLLLNKIYKTKKYIIYILCFKQI